LKRLRVSPLETHIGYWLRFASNHVSQAFSRKVESCGVTVAEWVVLRALFERSPLAPSELADALGTTRGAISKLVDRLVEKSLATKTAGEEKDRRFQSVALTPKGRALVPKLAALADQNDKEFFGSLRASERVMLTELMKRIVRKHGAKVVPMD
jgi:DNA-binding MarR family transcriptional regulator